MVRPHVASLVNQDTHAIKRRRTPKHKAHLIYITLAPPRGVAFYINCCYPSNAAASWRRGLALRKKLQQQTDEHVSLSTPESVQDIII